MLFRQFEFTTVFIGLLVFEAGKINASICKADKILEKYLAKRTHLNNAGQEKNGNFDHRSGDEN